MRVAKSRLGAIACLLAPALAGCAGSTAPPRWLEPPSIAQSEAFGGWIQVKHAEEGSKDARLRTQGELIAITAESLYVLTTTEGLRVVPGSRVESADLTAYDSKHEGLTTWTILGTLSTASHGIALALSAPVWIIVGTSATVSQSRAPLIKAKNEDWHALTKYARFPQGLPDTLDRGALEQKPRK